MSIHRPVVLTPKHRRLADRYAAAAHSLDCLWGEELPPVDDPWTPVAADVLDSDDEWGRSHGIVVQGDGLTVTALAHLLAALPGDAAIPRLPDRLRDPVGRAHEEAAAARWEVAARRVFRFGMRILRADRAGLYVRPPDADQCLLVASENWTADEVTAWRSIPMSSPLPLARSMRDRVPVWYNGQDSATPAGADRDLVSIPVPQRTKRWLDAVLVLSWSPRTLQRPLEWTQASLDVLADEIARALDDVPDILAMTARQQLALD